MDARDAEVRPSNWLVATTLLVLRECESHGYELMERAAPFGFGALNPGNLYRSLRQMEKEGLCESRWETSSSGEGPARRVYSITEAGEAYLELWARSLERCERTIEDFFRAYRGRPRSEPQGDGHRGEPRGEFLGEPAAAGNGRPSGGGS